MGKGRGIQKIPNCGTTTNAASKPIPALTDTQTKKNLQKIVTESSFIYLATSQPTQGGKNLVGASPGTVP